MVVIVGSLAGASEATVWPVSIQVVAGVEPGCLVEREFSSERLVFHAIWSAVGYGFRGETWAVMLGHRILAALGWCGSLCRGVEF